MDKKIILFDIDRTIFDTEMSGKKIKEVLAGVTKKSIEEIEKIDQDYKVTLESTTDFDFDYFLKLIADKTGIDLEILDQAVFKSQNFVLYPETKEVLGRLLASGHSLGIYSEGVSKWQTEKIKLTSISDYFDIGLIFIEKRKLSLESINKIPKGSIVIDDRKEVLETLKQHRSDLMLVWINRNYRQIVDGIKTIFNLKNLL